MKIFAFSTVLCAGLFLPVAGHATTDIAPAGQGTAIVTLQPRDDKQVSSPTADQLQLRIDGRAADITTIQPLHNDADPMEIVLLIDSGLRTSIGAHLDEIAHFLDELPTASKIAIAYMENGRAVFATPLTSDPAAAKRGLHLPAGAPGISASPYFCISDLAKNWPSKQTGVRRIAVMLSDGFDPYHPEFDPEAPYLQNAITDVTRAGLLVDGFYWPLKGHNNTGYSGQNMLQVLCESTGGSSFGISLAEPVSLNPYFDSLRKQLRNQYRISFRSPLHGKSQVVALSLRAKGINGHLDAPQKAFLQPATPAAAQ